MGDQASPAVIAHYREKFGLDRPLWEQYFSYLGNIMRGDFGLSLSDQKPAVDLIAAALPYTLRLGLTAFICGLILGSCWALSRRSTATAGSTASS